MCSFRRFISDFEFRVQTLRWWKKLPRCSAAKLSRAQTQRLVILDLTTFDKSSFYSDFPDLQECPKVPKCTTFALLSMFPWPFLHSTHGPSTILNSKVDISWDSFVCTSMLPSYSTRNDISIPTEVLGIAKAMVQQPTVLSIPSGDRWFQCVFHVTMAMSCQELCWKSLSGELLKWLHQFMEEEHTETCGLVEDFLKRGALPLLFFAKKAKSEIQRNVQVSKTKGTNGVKEPKKLATGENSDADAVSALLCIRLLAQQLQSMAQSTLVQSDAGFVEAQDVQQSNERVERADCSRSMARMTPETEDLALALAHWVSTEWCSPRIEVVVAWLCLICLSSICETVWSSHTLHLKEKKVSEQWTS